MQQAKDIMAEFMTKVEAQKEDGPTERVAKRFAVAAAAGEIATSLDVTGWNKEDALNAAIICYFCWLSNYRGKDHKEYKLVETLNNFIEKHGQSRFNNVDDEYDSKTINMVGFRKQNDYLDTYYMFPTAFKTEIVQPSDLTTKEAVIMLCRLGIIKGDASNNPQGPKKFKKKTHRYYEIDGNKLAEYPLDQ